MCFYQPKIHNVLSIQEPQLSAKVPQKFVHELLHDIQEHNPFLGDVSPVEIVPLAIRSCSGACVVYTDISNSGNCSYDNCILI